MIHPSETLALQTVEGFLRLVLRDSVGCLGGDELLKGDGTVSVGVHQRHMGFDHRAEDLRDGSVRMGGAQCVDEPGTVHLRMAVHSGPLCDPRPGPPDRVVARLCLRRGVIDAQGTGQASDACPQVALVDQPVVVVVYSSKRRAYLSRGRASIMRPPPLMRPALRGRNPATFPTAP